MKAVKKRSKSPEGSDDQSAPLREFEKSFSQHWVWKSKILRAISAGWLWRRDMEYLLPLSSAVEAGRRECLAILAGRVEDDARTRLNAAGEAATASDILASWNQEIEPRPGREEDDGLPTYLRYFLEQCQSVSKEAEVAEAAAFLWAGELVVGDLHAALRKGLGSLRVNQRAAASAKKKKAPPARAESRSPELLDALEALFVHQALGPAIQAAAERMLGLYGQLFRDMYQALRMDRMLEAFDDIQDRVSLAREDDQPMALYPGVGDIVCEAREDDRGIHFTVERYPGNFNALDPRVVRIPPGKTNNRHKHAHETLFYFVAGNGQMLIGDTWVVVKPGDAVFAPRWIMHQTQNTGDTELMVLAITDYYYTHQVYIGGYDKV